MSNNNTTTTTTTSTTPNISDFKQLLDKFKKNLNESQEYTKEFKEYILKAISEEIDYDEKKNKPLYSLLYQSAEEFFKYPANYLIFLEKASSGLQFGSLCTDNLLKNFYHYLIHHNNLKIIKNQEVISQFKKEVESVGYEISVSKQAYILSALDDDKSVLSKAWDDEPKAFKNACFKVLKNVRDSIQKKLQTYIHSKSITVFIDWFFIFPSDGLKADDHDHDQKFNQFLTKLKIKNAATIDPQVKRKIFDLINNLVQIKKQKKFKHPGLSSQQILNNIIEQCLSTNKIQYNRSNHKTDGLLYQDIPEEINNVKKRKILDELKSYYSNNNQIVSPANSIDQSDSSIIRTNSQIVSPTNSIDQSDGFVHSQYN